MHPSRTKKITGWILSGLFSLFLLGASGIPKFFDFPGKGEMMEHLGIPLSLLPAIAAVEIAVAVIYLIPRTAFLGAILATGYLGGAVFTPPGGRRTVRGSVSGNLGRGHVERLGVAQACSVLSRDGKPSRNEYGTSRGIIHAADLRSRGLLD